MCPWHRWLRDDQASSGSGSLSASRKIFCWIRCSHNSKHTAFSKAAAHHELLRPTCWQLFIQSTAVNLLLKPSALRSCEWRVEALVVGGGAGGHQHLQPLLHCEIGCDHEHRVAKAPIPPPVASLRQRRTNAPSLPSMSFRRAQRAQLR